MSDEPVRMAVVGVGYFGGYHCEKMHDLPGVQLVAVVDIDADRAAEAAGRFGAQALTDHTQLIGLVDAAVVAVPSVAHHSVAVDLLQGGVDVLVEKPLSTSLAHAEELCRLAEERSACLQVGHLERFNPILAESLARLHKPRYIRMERLGPFPGRGSDVGVVYELMTHDLDILLQVSQAEVRSVSATGWRVVTPMLDVVAARVEFGDGLVADLNASRVSGRQVRAFSVLDERGLLEVDLAERRLRRNEFIEGKQRSEELSLDPGDALLDQDRAFVGVLTDGRRPLVGGSAGRAAVELAERIMACIDPTGRGA